MRGLVPRWGRSGAWQNPPCQLAIPNHNSGFSYLGAPATAGMSDSYENGVTRPQVCLNATGPHFVILAEAGIQRGRVAPTTPKHLQRPGLIFIPWCAGNSRRGRLVRKHVPDSDPGCALQLTSMPALHRRILPNCRPMADGGMRKCSAGACPPLGSEWGVAESAVPIRCTKPLLPLFIPWCAGNSRHGRLL